MKVKIEDNILTVQIPIKQPFSLSASGKTQLVASTHGNIKTEVMVEGKPLYRGV